VEIAIEAPRVLKGLWQPWQSSRKKEFNAKTPRRKGAKIWHNILIAFTLLDDHPATKDLPPQVFLNVFFEKCQKNPLGLILAFERSGR
jgi:hypothetical protein